MSARPPRTSQTTLAEHAARVVMVTTSAWKLAAPLPHEAARHVPQDWLDAWVPCRSRPEPPPAILGR